MPRKYDSPRNTTARRRAEAEAAAMAQMYQTGAGSTPFFKNFVGTQYQNKYASSKAALEDQFWTQQDLSRAVVADQIQGAMPAMAAAEKVRLQDAGVTDPGALMGMGYQLGTAETPEQLAAAQGLIGAVSGSPTYSSVARATTIRAQQQQAIELNTAYANMQRAELELDRAITGELSPNQREGVINGLRDDFANVWGTYEEQLGSYQQAAAAVNTNNRSGALAAVIKLAKVLDPGSVVRTEEGRAVSDAAAGSMANQLVQAYNFAAGQGFTPEARLQFLETLGAVTGPALQQATDIVSNYTFLAESRGIDPAQIMANKTGALELVQKQIGVAWE